MTAEQIIAVITAAKAAGISWLKAEGLEFRVGKAPETIPLDASIGKTSNVTQPDVVLLREEKEKTKHRIEHEEEEKVKHRIEELKSIMGMDDMDLIDRLFPEPKEEETEAAS